MSAGVLYGATFRRGIIEFRRYLFDSLSGIVTLYGFFMMIFLGARAIGRGAPGFGDTLSGLVVSFAVWTLAIFVYSAITQSLVQEAAEGTLEQLAMSPYGLTRVLLARVVTDSLVEVGIISVLLVLMMVSTGRWLHIDPVTVVPIVALTYLGLVGLGFALGGLAVVFKRVQTAMQIVQVLLLGLVATPAESYPVLKYFPLSWGSSLLRRSMVDGVPVYRMPAADLLFLVVNSVAYFAAGVLVFRMLETVARNRGLLGHY